MGKIILKNVRCYSFHGCLKEEGVIGSEYLVDLKVTASLKKSAQSDRLSETVDYVLLNQIIKHEMSKPSKLLETVADRINKSVFKKDLRITKSTVTITKVCPPINGDVEGVSVKLKQKKDSKF
ncbi:dihydroneopterin aldolase [Flavobacteriaceae bacterium]|jgi:7,8-dihydroneopterin aldolase/epimerase/oxygenase|nr:dihydroneopterin aldolase [Flavobacteriaceae bacterium]MDC1337657.1 dihydroneopterin aldolase [Flavobacteriaceae bacterium]MDC3348567.1 dihydroneopterin aldolase [Flavobacteriaceae bacterium]|tara:strand:- start:6 stop:374 length:369 start_codon:yes stop_codon:yes gene_type:complete